MVADLGAQLQWLPPTIYPNLLASLGIEGRFKLWAEDPSAAPGRRFSNAARHGAVGSAHPASSSSRGHYQSGSQGPTSASGAGTGINNSDATANNPKAAFETRNTRSPYRSFSMKHSDDTRHTYLALLAADGGLTVYENEQPEDLTDYTQMDEIAVCARPARGEETAFRVRFDPNLEVCYSALRAGVPADALSLVVAAMDTVKIYRTRDIVSSSLGVATAGKQFYLAAEISGHRGLVRDVVWAPGNIRGYDIIATACQDGFVRVFSVTTPVGGASDAASEHAAAGGEAEQDEGAGWTAGEVKKHSRRSGGADEDVSGQGSSELMHALPRSGIRAGFDQLRSGGAEKRATAAPAQVKHVVTEISKLDSHRTPVWRVGFDDDGQLLGSVGDEGKLMCYRQKPDGTWAKSSELAMMKMRMAAP